MKLTGTFAGALLAGALLLSTSMAPAAARGQMRGSQNRMGGMYGMRGQRPMMGRNRMAHVPGLEANQLTAQQRQQIAQIRRDTQQQMRQVRMNRSLSAQERQGRLASIRQDQHSRVMGVLTPEQRAEFRDWWGSRPGMMGGPVAGRRARGMMDQPGMMGGMGAMGTPMGSPVGEGALMGIPGLQVHLLTPDQRQQIAQIRQGERQQMQDVRSDTSLSAQQRQDRMAQVRSDMHDKIMNVLTPDQKTELQNWWSTHPGSPMSQ